MKTQILLLLLIFPSLTLKSYAIEPSVQINVDWSKFMSRHDYKLPSARDWNLYQSSSKPLFPFGFGSSYTTFEFGDPEISSSEISIGDSVTVSIDVKNTGSRTGDEVVQLNIHDEFASVVRPRKELKGFKRISLRAGQTQKVRFIIGSKELEFWKDGKWVVEPGDFSIMLGPNSVDLKSVTLKVL